MLGNPISRCVLGVAFFCAAVGCGGGSKSKAAEAKTSPVASTPAETSPPEAAATPGAGNEGNTGTMGTGTQGTGQTGSTEESQKQPVSGTTGSEMGTGSQTGSTTGTGSATPGSTSETESASKPAIGEPQIFALLTAANQHEIAISKLALKQSKNKEVKKFANLMVKEHGKMLAEGNKLAKKLKVKPEDNDDVRSLKSDSDVAMQKLGGLKGAEFDRAFTDQMVTDHQKVLDLIDSKIAPAASGNADITKLVDGAKPKVQSHLDQATKLRDKLSSSS